MSNMQVYILRANCIAVAGDYTPFWANRDNNHGWEVVLDKNGRGNAGLFNKAAKIYRKMFSHQPGNLAFQATKGEPLPGWLANKSYIDVTDQYLETTDITVALEYPSPKPARFAYICVFNGGEWRPIHWSPIRDGKATFTKMGRGIAYLVAYYCPDDKIEPAAAPFLLSDNGRITRLAADSKQVGKIALTAIKPTIRDDDLKKELVGKKVEQGKEYELFVYERGWKSLGKSRAAAKDQGLFEKLPIGGLYWMVTGGDRETARIFTIDAGKQRFW